VHCHWPGTQACHDIHALESIKRLLCIQYGAQLLVRLNPLTWWCSQIVRHEFPECRNNNQNHGQEGKE
jgi:hypothetical protein